MRDRMSASAMSSTTPIAVPQRNANRDKSDAATQTGVGIVDSTRIAPKRTHSEDESGDPADGPPALKRLAVQINTHVGRKVVHVNPQGYVPRPVDLVLDEWVSEASVRYLYKILHYQNRAGYWIPIHLVPLASSWAVVDEDPAFTHRVQNERPLLVWVIGVLVEVRLSPPRLGGLPILHASVDFVRMEDKSRALAIHNAAASVALDTIKRLDVSSPVSESQGMPSHNNVYDARRKLQRASAMETISPGRILKGDIVMLECTVVRYEDADRVKTVDFVLNSLYWLIEKPRAPVVVTQRVAEFPDVISLD